MRLHDTAPFYVTPIENLSTEGDMNDPTQVGRVESLFLFDPVLDPETQALSMPSLCLVYWSHKRSPPYEFVDPSQLFRFDMDEEEEEEEETDFLEEGDEPQHFGAPV